MKYDETELQKKESKKIIFIGNRKCMKLVLKKNMFFPTRSLKFSGKLKVSMTNVKSLEGLRIHRLDSEPS